MCYVLCVRLISCVSRSRVDDPLDRVIVLVLEYNVVPSRFPTV